jgi:hypothetical protein
MGYGLAGSAAMSLLGNANTPKLSSQPQGTNPSYIRPYTYSANPTNPYTTTTPATTVPYNGLGSSAEKTYFNQNMAAQPIYKAAEGGLTPNLDFMGNGAYPMSQQKSPRYAVPSQMPTSAQQVSASYEQNTNPLTGQPITMAEGGLTPEQNNGSMYGMQNAIQGLSPETRAAMSNAVARVGNAMPNFQQPAQQFPQVASVAPRMSSNDAVKAYNDAIMQKAIDTYVTPQQNPLGQNVLFSGQQQSMAPQGYMAQQLPANFDQTILDQYRAANPNLRSYNAATQTYGAGIPTQSQYDAFKAQKEAEAAARANQGYGYGYGYGSEYGYGGGYSTTGTDEETAETPDAVGATNPGRRPSAQSPLCTLELHLSARSAGA